MSLVNEYSPDQLAEVLNRYKALSVLVSSAKEGRDKEALYRLVELMNVSDFEFRRDVGISLGAVLKSDPDLFFIGVQSLDENIRFRVYKLVIESNFRDSIATDDYPGELGSIGHLGQVSLSFVEMYEHYREHPGELETLSTNHGRETSR